MAHPLKDRTAVVGIGNTRYGKNLPYTELELATEAILNACADAGIDPTEIDGLCSFTAETTDEVTIAQNLGLRDITFFSQIGYGGGAGCGIVGHAAMAVATGQCKVACAWRSRIRSGKATRVWSQTSGRLADHWRWTRPYGLIRPVDEVAMLTRRAMHDRGYTRDHLANVAIACRNHANRNPNAFMYERPMTRDDYMNARWISEPLCLFDNCLETDGAGAVIIVSAERAKDMPQPPVSIHAFGQGFGAQMQNMTHFYNDDPLVGPAWSTAKVLWSQADVTPVDVKVAQIYDAFTPLILLSLEGYGFCPPGEGGSFTDDGNCEWGRGKLPINTSGGGLSEAYIHGFNLVLEGIRQIRGTSLTQVADADVSFVTSGEAVPTSAILFTKG